MSKYISDKRLTDEIITEIMNRCGLDIITAKVDSITGKKIHVNGIVRDDNMIVVNCTNRRMAELFKMATKKVPMMGMFESGVYSFGDEIVSLEDFSASRFKISDGVDDLDEKLFKEYYKAMRSIFGSEYDRDAEAFYANFTNEEVTQMETEEDEVEQDKGE